MEPLIGIEKLLLLVARYYIVHPSLFIYTSLPQQQLFFMTASTKREAATRPSDFFFFSSNKYVVDPP